MTFATFPRCALKSRFGLAAMFLLAWASIARAANPLKEATVDRVVNSVMVELQQNPAKAAAVADVLIPDDLLYTGQTSLAQMIFDDASLVRVGQNSRFQFMPSERQFVLDKGVMVMITPPGAGGAEIVTPSAIAGVQGSLVMANSREVDGVASTLFLNFTSVAQLLDRDRNAIGTLQPGEVALVSDGQVLAIARFDRCSAVENGPLLTGLHLSHDNLLAAESPAARETLQMEREILMSQGACDRQQIAIFDEPPTLEIPEFSRPDNPPPDIEPPIDRPSQTAPEIERPPQPPPPIAIPTQSDLPSQTLPNGCPRSTVKSQC
ncbi:FecR domain-containing protein [Synechococcus sp. PCC 7336]|uniref:FecR domain-containing protein n=1 Tax=Synechococcus sp. PCC 7336 TaxID=195250 RepID=UPI00034CCC74|nr:FecR domain-containing protein [Synechococcus sp. PCC 7336]